MKKAVPSQRRKKNDETVLTPLEHIHGKLPTLMVADIVLIRHKDNLTRALLRKITNSYWDHSALIVFTKNPALGYSHDIIEESIQFGLLNKVRRGVELHRLEKYLNDPEKYDVGIKRVPILDDDIRERVRSFMLMNVDAPYYRLPFLDFFFAWLSKGIRAYVLRRQRFSCSGLIQKAFYEASDWNNRYQLVFRKYGGTPIELQDLTTPGDFATSPNCEWIWNRH